MGEGVATYGIVTFVALAFIFFRGCLLLLDMCGDVQVGLVNILDIYFEDVYTLPSKQQLTCDVVRCPKELTKSKVCNAVHSYFSSSPKNL